MPHGPYTPLVDGVTEAEAANVNIVYDALEDTYTTAEVDNLIPAALVDLDTTVTGSQLNSLKTKVDGIESAADVTDAANVAAAGAVMEADTSTASMAFVVDEDDMSSNSATKVPTQQSVKAYVDASGGGGGGGGGMDAALMPAVAAHTSDWINTTTHGIGNGGSSTFGASDNIIYFYPIYIPHPLTPDNVSVEVTTGSTAGSVRVGAFTYDQPTRVMTLIEDYGTAGTVTTGRKDITPGTGTSLDPGWVWIGVWLDEACTMRATGVLKSLGSNNLIGSGSRGGITYAGTYGAFAASYALSSNQFTTSLMAIGISD